MGSLADDLPRAAARDDHFLAGTDSGGGYPNSIRGFALHDELEMMESLGMPTVDALRAATVNAPIALGDSTSSGSIELGKRADLLLLDRTPLLTVNNLRSPAGMMVRRIWLNGAKLGSIREMSVSQQPHTSAVRAHTRP